ARREAGQLKQEKAAREVAMLCDGAASLLDRISQAFVIGHSRGDARHQAVVIDSVEKLFKIEIDHDVVAVGDVTLRPSHCLMGGAPRSKAVTVLGKRRVPPLLENLQHSRRCQSNGASSTRSATCPLASDDLRCKGAPLRQCGRASLLVHLAGDEMALLIEMVVDLGVN